MDDESQRPPQPARTHEAERLLLGSEPRYTRQQVAELAGVSAERATRLWRSLGFATAAEDDVVFTDADVDALRTVTRLHDAGLADADLEIALTRALGQTMARLTEWQVDMLRRRVLAGAADPKQAEELNAAGLDAAAALIPEVEQLQRYVWRRHLLAAGDRLLAVGAEPSEAAPLTVGFADIVGFTSLSRGLSESRLSEFLESFEDSASAVVTEHGGRVIKTVGDEVMFVADDAHAGADIGLDLADRLSALDGRPDLRIGLAYGPVLRRLGDVYGTVVNLASRLTALAHPGTVLIDRELASELEDDARYAPRKLRRVSVRGFAHLQPWLLRRAAPDARA
ncbi:MAG TPA: adenylate/guanylate cyclase domain-containing protein [Pseudonocardia sp.]|nr:adenylate/guanylate cyclase domain-containing protein [Pseudonocardia sp.]